MNYFPLFKRPSRLIFLDDDALFLEVLSMALPAHWQAHLYLHAPACVKALNANGKAWQADMWQQQDMVAQSQEGASLIPMLLDYWRNNPARYDLVQLAAFDYAMPALNGLEALQQVQNWPGQRVLLTGQADESLAVRAFNQGTIDQFILKQTIGVRNQLEVLLQPLLDKPLLEQQVLWRSVLSQKQQDLMLRTDMCEALKKLVHEQAWIEYAVTGLPFGVLGVDADGAVTWLQLEPVDELEDLVELAQDEGLPTPSLAAVLRGESLVNVELRLALEATAHHKAIELAVTPAFKVIHGVMGSWHKLDESYALDAKARYTTWLAANPSQVVLG